MNLKDYREQIKRYHKYREDKKIKIVKKLHDDGYTMHVLVRMVGKNGKAYSCIDVASELFDGVSEQVYTTPDCEDIMVDGYLKQLEGGEE